MKPAKMTLIISGTGRSSIQVFGKSFFKELPKTSLKLETLKLEVPLRPGEYKIKILNSHGQPRVQEKTLTVEAGHLYKVWASRSYKGFTAEISHKLPPGLPKPRPVTRSWPVTSFLISASFRSRSCPFRTTKQAFTATEALGRRPPQALSGHLRRPK